MSILFSCFNKDYLSKQVDLNSLSFHLCYVEKARSNRDVTDSQRGLFTLTQRISLLEVDSAKVRKHKAFFRPFSDLFRL